MEEKKKTVTKKKSIVEIFVEDTVKHLELPKIEKNMDIFALKDIPEEELEGNSHLKLLAGCVKSAENIKTNFVTLACYLYHMSLQNKLLNDLGFYNVAEFSEQYFGFKKSTTFSLTSLAYKFCDYNDFKLKPKFKDFSQSQLVELSSLYCYEYDNITKDYTVQDIRDYKKALKSGGWSSSKYDDPRGAIETFRALEVKKPEKKPLEGPCADSILFNLRLRLKNDNVSYDQDVLRTFLSTLLRDYVVLKREGV